MPVTSEDAVEIKQPPPSLVARFAQSWLFGSLWMLALLALGAAAARASAEPRAASPVAGAVQEGTASR